MITPFSPPNIRIDHALRASCAMLLLGVLAIASGAQAACGATPPPNVSQILEAEVLYLPTPQHAVQAMLRLAGVTAKDVVYDLGSGDGRIPIAAAQLHGARAVGIELDTRMLELSRCNARAAGVGALVEFRQQDLFKADLREATVITLFLFPELNMRLRGKLLAELRPGTRIVSHRFGLGDWLPERTIEAKGNPILLWTVPPR